MPHGPMKRAIGVVAFNACAQLRRRDAKNSWHHTTYSPFGRGLILVSIVSIVANSMVKEGISRSQGGGYRT
jgi:hypothetical protein